MMTTQIRKKMIGLAMLWLLLKSGAVMGAGICAPPAISAASVDTTGTWSCHINDSGDKVEMTASAHDYDDEACGCNPVGGDRIDLSATTWEIASGTLDSATGASNGWTAGNAKGQYTLTVTFKDKNDGALYDDDDKEVQKTLTAFKVGIHLSTSGGSSLTTWEDGAANEGFGGFLDLGLNVLVYSEETDADSTTATWTLQVDPDGTPIKGNIRGWADPYGNGYIRGVTADSDRFDDGSATFSISVSLGLVSFSYSQSLAGDDNVSVCSVGAGFGSEIHVDYAQKIELVSRNKNGPLDNKGVSHDPSEAAITGKPGTSKQAEWEYGYKMQKEESGGNWAAAECDGEVHYQWKNGTLPDYIY